MVTGGLMMLPWELQEDFSPMGKVHIVGIKNRLEIEWLKLTKRIDGWISWEMHFCKYLIQLQCYYIDCEAIGGVFPPRGRWKIWHFSIWYTQNQSKALQTPMNYRFLCIESIDNAKRGGHPSFQGSSTSYLPHTDSKIQTRRHIVAKTAKKNHQSHPFCI